MQNITVNCKTDNCNTNTIRKTKWAITKQAVEIVWMREKQSKILQTNQRSAKDRETIWVFFKQTHEVHKTQKWCTTSKKNAKWSMEKHLTAFLIHNFKWNA